MDEVVHRNGTRKEGVGDQIQPSKVMLPSGRLPPIGPYLLNFPEHPKIVPPAGNHALTT